MVDIVTYGMACGYADKKVTEAQLNPYEVEGACLYTDLSAKSATAKKNDVWTLSQEYPAGSASPTYPIGTAFAYDGVSSWRVIQLGNRISNAAITVTQGGAEKGSFTLNQDNAATIALDGGGEQWTDLPVADFASHVFSAGDKIRITLKKIPYIDGTMPADWTTMPDVSVMRFSRLDMYGVKKIITLESIGTHYNVQQEIHTFIENYSSTKCVSVCKMTVVMLNNGSGNKFMASGFVFNAAGCVIIPSSDLDIDYYIDKIEYIHTPTQ